MQIIDRVKVIGSMKARGNKINSENMVILTQINCKILIANHATKIHKI